MGQVITTCAGCQQNEALILCANGCGAGLCGNTNCFESCSICGGAICCKCAVSTDICHHCMAGVFDEMMDFESEQFLEEQWLTNPRIHQSMAETIASWSPDRLVSKGVTLNPMVLLAVLFGCVAVGVFSLVRLPWWGI